MQSSLCLVFAFGGSQVLDGYVPSSHVFGHADMLRRTPTVTISTITAGELSSFLMYSMYLGFSTAAVSRSYSEFTRAAGATERVLKLLDRESSMEMLSPDDGDLNKIAQLHGEKSGLSVSFENVSQN